jgi:uncharacterized membrane protein YbaN (DUF454 family)
MKKICILLGSLCVALGIAGIFLPLLPTTPFLLLSAALYAHGSKNMYEKLIEHKQLGPYIRNFREKRAIPLRAKISSVAMLWATILASAFFFTENIWIRILLIFIAIGVTWHILSFKTLK